MTNRVVTQETKDKISKSLIGNNRASAGKGMVWVNDGVNNHRMFPQDVDEDIYTFGMIVPDDYAQKMKEKLSNRVHINKDGKDVRLNYSIEVREGVLTITE